MKNADIRFIIMEANLKHWQIAEALGISAPTLSVWLRKTLSPEQRHNILAAIKQLQEVSK